LPPAEWGAGLLHAPGYLHQQQGFEHNDVAARAPDFKQEVFESLKRIKPDQAIEL
jgi:hypothetical protein